jgi:serine/threonine-protein kinase
MGRRSACAVAIPDEKASREHAVITRKGDDYFLQDLSRNGTFLNGTPASKMVDGSALRFGDIIRIGETEMEFVDERAEPAQIDIPGYTVMERVGLGGMGIVYKAKQLSMERIVALKILNERYSANGEFVDRFIREARAAGKLNHPNVIHVHDISKANGRHYFSMEFIDGASVKEILRKEKKLPASRAIDIAVQAAKALEFAHENGIVHRDVKPDNIMLTKEGIVKLADLGIAKTFEEEPLTTPTGQRRVMGTPHYMAPEQALGKAIDHRVDIYALGATFYHMVTGTTPFAGHTAHEILKAHIQKSLPPIQELNPQVPDPVCFIIERMMAKLPEKRYPNMSRLIADLERVQKGLGDIDRIEAGESTIGRALNIKPAEEGVEEDLEAEGAEEGAEGEEAEVVTGQQKKISGVVLVVAMVAVFLAVVGTVVVLAQHFRKPTQEIAPINNPNPSPTTNTGQGTVARSEARKLLDAAVIAQKRDDPSEYTRLLEEIRSKYPSSAEAEEAAKLLQEYQNQDKMAARKTAETALAAAETFETANPANLAEVAKKFDDAATAAKAFADIADKAKARAAAIRKKMDAENSKVTETASRAAVDGANTARGRNDFDAARASLQGFLDRYPNAAQKADVEASLKNLDTDAQEKFKAVQQETATMDIPSALARWTLYSNTIKDSKTAEEVKTARTNLESKAEQFAQDELNKAGERAKKFAFTEGMSMARAVGRKLAGIKKWEDAAKAREDSIKFQKDLHEKFLACAAKKLQAGGVPVPFLVIQKMQDVKWKVSRLQGEEITLDDLIPGKPGTLKRLGDLTPKELYDFYMAFLPPVKELTAIDHKSLAAFCTERGLTTEAQTHEAKAAGN